MEQNKRGRRKSRDFEDCVGQNYVKEKIKNSIFFKGKRILRFVLQASLIGLRRKLQSFLETKAGEESHEDQVTQL